MFFEYKPKEEDKGEPVALVYYNHLIFRGEDGEAVYLSGPSSESPPPATGFIHSKYTFQDIIDFGGELSRENYTPIYKGDSVTITF